MCACVKHLPLLSSAKQSFIWKTVKLLTRFYNAPPLTDVAQIHPVVTRLLGQNPGPMTLQVSLFCLIKNSAIKRGRTVDPIASVT